MIVLDKLNADDLSHTGWAALLAKIPEIGKADTDPRFFNQMLLFKRHLRQLVSIAAELNSNQDAASKAYEHISQYDLTVRKKTISKFKDTHQQTYAICLDSLQREFDELMTALRERNAEALQDRYRRIKDWPIRLTAKSA